MKIIALSAILTLVYCSCNFRIFVDGHYERKETGLTAHWRSSYDSCIILDTNDILPDSSFLVNSTRVLSPFVWLTTKSYDTIIINKAMNEARLDGANVIRIVDKGSSKFTRYELVTQLYQVKEPYLSAYKNKLDSINRIDEHFAVVQIWSYTYSWRKSTPIYFEDSLVASCKAPSNRKTGRGKEIHRLDLKFDRPGILSTLVNGASIYKSGVLLHPGKVYKLIIIPTTYGDRLFRQGSP